MILLESIVNDIVENDTEVLPNDYSNKSTKITL